MSMSAMKNGQNIIEQKDVDNYEHTLPPLNLTDMKLYQKFCLICKKNTSRENVQKKYFTWSDLFDLNFAHLGLD